MYPIRDLDTFKNGHLQLMQINLLNAEAQSTSFYKPVAIGYYGLNTDRGYESKKNINEIFYYRPPKKMPIDLNEGYGLAKTKKEMAYSEGLDHLLEFIIENKLTLIKQINQLTPKPMLQIEFVCYRGLLRLLMCTPYEKRNDWCIHVTRYNGTFYMWRPDTKQSAEERQNASDMQRRMTSWGFKFEQCCLSTSPKDTPDTSKPVDECPEFACVYKTLIGNFNVLYGAEMDGVSSDQMLQPNNLNISQLKFVELKVRQEKLNPRQEDTFKRHKTRHWWSQSYLAGIDDIYVGLRTPNGNVNHISHYHTNELPQLCNNLWTPNTCKDFLVRFLKAVKHLMSKIDCPHTVYAFHFKSQTSKIYFEYFKDHNEHSFLPDWYIEFFEKHDVLKM